MRLAQLDALDQIDVLKRIVERLHERGQGSARSRGNSSRARGSERACRSIRRELHTRSIANTGDDRRRDEARTCGRFRPSRRLRPSSARSSAGASMNVASAFLLTMFGTAVGSFLNVCIHRLPLRKSLMWPGSHCPPCDAPVKPYDNIPIAGYLWLRRTLPQLPRADFDSVPHHRAGDRRSSSSRATCCSIRPRCWFSGCCSPAR